MLYCSILLPTALSLKEEEGLLTYIDSIKTGFKVINKNWQLVLIQVGAMFISLLGFFIFIGLPLAIAFIIFGIDLTEFSRPDNIFNLFKRPSDLLSRYLGLAILLFTSLFIYIISIFIIGVFVFGGSLGSISRTIKESVSFHFSTFWKEGKRLFFPLVGFTALIGLGFLVLAFVLGLLGGSISALISLAREQEAALALFLGIFFSLFLFVLGLGLILIVLSITIYGAAIIALNGEGPVAAIKKAVQYLYRKPQGLYLYCLIFLAFVVINFAIIAIGIPMGLVPIIGPLLSFIYQLSVYFLQSYFGLSMIATILVYYYSTSEEFQKLNRPPFLSPTDSIQAEDISPSGASQQEKPLHEIDGTEQK